ncbi:hypothetical protein BFP46_22700 [Bacillus licheniformis]|nr:hypothetical protein BFP46_22700 [Bacillus licheniformis]
MNETCAFVVKSPKKRVCTKCDFTRILIKNCNRQETNRTAVSTMKWLQFPLMLFPFSPPPSFGIGGRFLLPQKP